MVITEEQVIDIVIRANPAPTNIETDELPSAPIYLATLRDRSSEMQTIEKSATEDKEPGRGGKGWWLAAAILIIVMATVGIFMFGGNDQTPVATTPQVEEPVPNTEPQAQEDPAPEETVPETTPTTEPEVVSLSGLPIFEGQPPAGDYEAVGENLRIVFKSDGSWKDCVKSECNNRGGIEIKPQELLSVFGWFEPLAMTGEEFHTMFSETQGLIVGDVEPFSPTLPESDWTGSRFSVDVDPDAGRDTACDLAGGLDGEPYPCVKIEDMGRFWISEEANTWLPMAIHGPTQFYVLTQPDGTSIWAAALWFPYPQAPEGEYESLIERMQELVQSIRFVD